MDLARIQPDPDPTAAMVHGPVVMLPDPTAAMVLGPVAMLPDPMAAMVLGPVATLPDLTVAMVPGPVVMLPDLTAAIARVQARVADLAHHQPILRALLVETQAQHPTLRVQTREDHEPPVDPAVDLNIVGAARVRRPDMAMEGPAVAVAPVSMAVLAEAEHVQVVDRHAPPMNAA